MTCVRHHNVTQSSYIVIKTLCALPSPHQEDTPDVAPSAPGLMQKLPLLRGSKTKQSQTADTPEKPRRGNAGSRPENRTPGRRGPSGGSHGGRQRGLTQRGRGRPRRDGGTGSAARHRTSGPEPCRPRVLAQNRSEGASQEAGGTCCPPAPRASGFRPWRTRPSPPGHGLQPRSASARGPGRGETCCWRG